MVISLAQYNSFAIHPWNDPNGEWLSLSQESYPAMQMEVPSNSV